MKKKFLMFILSFCFIIPAMFCLSACNSTTPADIEFKVENGFIQYYDGEQWEDLIAIEELKGEDGDDGVGIDGKQVQFQTTETHIQWRYVGDSTWKNLIALEDLKGDDGDDVSEKTYTITYEYGADFDISDMFNNYKETQETKSNEWITGMPTPIDEYKEHFVGWFIKGTDKQIENYDFIGGNVTLEAKWENLTFNYENCSFNYGSTYGENGYTCYIDKRQENVIVPSVYNNGYNGLHKVNAIYSSNNSADESDTLKLKTITLPNTIKLIKSSALSYCKELTSLTIPASVMNIEELAIFGCDNLETIVVDEDNEVYDSRNDCNAVIKTQTNSIIVGCKNTEIPNTVKYISNYAFAANNGIESITIPNSVLEIGEDAFAYCENLESVSFEENSKLTKIGKMAFTESGLQHLEIPESVSEIGSWAFSDCAYLEQIDFNATNMKDTTGDIFDLAGELTDGISVNIGQDVTRIPAYLFAHSSLSTNTCAVNVRNVNFVENSKCETIGNHAFQYCYYLTSFTIPSSLKTIEDSAFWGCYNLVEITNLSTINVYKDTSSNGLVGKYAKAIFTDNSQSSNIITIDNVVYYKNSESSYLALMPTNRLGCKSVHLSPATTEINISAFENCENLESIVIPDGVATIGNNAFDNCSNLKSISIPKSVITIGQTAFSSCGNLESITVESGNTKYMSQSNCLIEIDTKTLILGCKNSIIPTSNIVNTLGDYAFAYCKGLTTITIPSNITNVGHFTFEYCNDLTEVNIMEGITNIGYGMFYGCRNLTTINIPNSVLEIQYLAFGSCEKLETITISKNVATINNAAFHSCKNLESIIVANDNDKYVSTNNCLIEKDTKKLVLGCKNSIIPLDGSVTIIGEEAFWGLGSINDIIIPTSITTIEDDVFVNCYFNKIYYLGSQTDWNNITIGTNSNITPTKTYFYSENQPTAEGNYWHYDTDGTTPIAW